MEAELKLDLKKDHNKENDSTIQASSIIKQTNY